MSGKAGIQLTIIVASGPACEVHFAVCASGKCPGLDFLNGECEEIREGGKGKLKSTARARFNVLFEQMAKYGNVSGKRFGKEMGKLSAFKHEVRNLQIRFPCFRDGSSWIITHGFIKPGAQKGLGDWPTSEVNRAEMIMDDYFRHKPQPTPASRKVKK